MSSAKLILPVLITLLCLPSALVCEDKQPPSQKNVFFDNALREYSEGNYEKSIANLKVALVSDPDDSIIKNFMAKIYLEISQKAIENRSYALAMKYVEATLAVQPENRKAESYRQYLMAILMENQQLASLNASTSSAIASALPFYSGKDERFYRIALNSSMAVSIILALLCLFLIHKAFSYRKRMEFAVNELKILEDDRRLLLSKLMQTKEDTAKEKIALMAQNLFEFNPAEALAFLNNMAKNNNPSIRINVVFALAMIGNPETLELLFQLYADPDTKVKGEALKHIRELDEKINKGELKVEQIIQHKIKYLLANEKSKREWIL